MKFNLSEHYRPYPKQKLAHQIRCLETFFGGSKGGAKSFFLLWYAFVHCCRYGENAHAVLFRRHYDDLKNTLILEAKRFWPEEVATYNGNDYEFRFRNGALCQFRHMQHKSDVMKHFGRQYTFIGIDELTLIPDEEWYQILLTALRSPKEGRIFPRMISCSNPRGPGHSWAQKRFRIGDEYPDTKPYHPFETKEGTKRVYIPSRVTDNKVLMEKDPDYIQRLRQLPENLRKAHLEGVWTLMEDTAFPEFSVARHVVERRFTIPEDWEVIRFIDWGYTSSPFYIGWFAKDPSTFTTYLVDEWDGSTKGERGGIHPLKLAVSDVAQGIIDRTGEGNYPQPRTTIGDTSMWRSNSKDSGPTVSDLFLGNGVRPLKKASKDRPARFQLFHELLRESEDTGRPRLMAFPHCTRFIDCMSNLRLKEDGSEDVEKEKGDDPYDGAGYGLRYLYRGIEATRQKKPQIPKNWMQYIEADHNRSGQTIAGICPY